MTARRLLGLIVAPALAATALLAGPAPSFAAGTYVYHGGGVILARVRGSNGYRLNFSENEKHYFEVKAIGHDTNTRYDLRAEAVGKGRISADLGRRGRFDLRFVPVGKPEPVPIVSWCTGPKGSWQPGYLVGRIRFHGERGYTEASLRKVPAVENTWSALRCHYLQGSGFERRATARRASVGASYVTSRPTRVYERFGAVLFHRHARPRGRRVIFRAERTERAGRISIEREAKVEAPESTFALTGGKLLPEEVEVTPPAPFSGSAAFTRTPESTFEWTGDLSVTFPGLDPDRLAGSSFSADVCALGGCVRQEWLR